VMPLKFRVNGVEYSLEVEPHERLCDVLRNRLGLMSVKTGCGVGDCGLCTVLVNGKPVTSCLVLAYRASGSEITTVEALGTEKNLHPLQKAFIDVGAVQCGYCIPAALLVLKHLHDTNPYARREEVRHALRSVLCRCGSYLRFEEAFEQVRGK
jgi:aerobic-type carbon monoxide dehydrogenase small subunit (CoxS/CutS family)